MTGLFDVQTQRFGSDFDASTSNGSFSGQASPARQLGNVYCCNVEGCSFTVLHKSEGKWHGDAVFFDANNQILPKGMHVCSSRISFHDESASWKEQQLVTSKDGVSSKQNLGYRPKTDGLCKVQSDQSLLRDAYIELKEVSSNVVILVARDASGNPLLTETTTYSQDFQVRTRTGQRFAENGIFIGNYLITERKYLDEESGALTRSPSLGC